MYAKEYSYRHWKRFRREPLRWTPSAASKRGIVVLYSSPLQRQKEYSHKSMFQSEIKGEAIGLFEREGFRNLITTGEIWKVVVFFFLRCACCVLQKGHYKYQFLVSKLLFKYSHSCLKLADCFTVFMSLGVKWTIFTSKFMQFLLSILAFL